MTAFRQNNRRAIGRCASGLACAANGGRKLILVCICAAGVASTAIVSKGQESPPASQPSTDQAPPTASTKAVATKFKKMSLDELMDVEVTSVSKRESTVGQSPAAISVITQEDIRRSGATSIPEALRMVPGMDVAQNSSNAWTVSSRGFSSTANKVLVLIDGRSVYDLLGGSVNWDVQNPMMQDIDRIEVIRGPAGALWGDNAVNGVVNIISKSAEETQGFLITAGGGSEERDFGDVRYGWKMGDNAYARVYVQHFERDQTLFADGSGSRDAWQMSQSGFRMDWQPSSDNHYTFHGDIYEGYENSLLLNPNPDLLAHDVQVSGGNVVGAWEHDLGNGSGLKLQMYYDRTNRSSPYTSALTLKEDRDTFDIDFQDHTHLDKLQDFTWGFGYRVTSDQVHNAFPIAALVPDHRSIQVISAFAQYEFQVIEDRLRLTVGSKFEHNDLSGFEVQPNARLLWKIDKQQTAWVAASRAVRTPDQTEEDVHIVIPPILSVEGGPHLRSESVIAYELGYRIEPVNWLALDVATYYNRYTHLISFEGPPSALVERNGLHGDTYGVEVGATWKTTDWWTIRAAYTYLQERLANDRGTIDTISAPGEGESPNNQIYLRSSMNFPHNIEFDLMGRYVERLSGFSPPGLQVPGAVNTVPSYISLDARLGWRPNDHLEISVVGQNLLDNQHPEFGGGGTGSFMRREIPRSVYGMVTFRW